jgi:hypothetical protein
MKPLALTPAEPLASLMDPAQVAVNALASSSRHFNNPHQQSKAGLAGSSRSADALVRIPLHDRLSLVVWPKDGRQK